MLDLHSRRVTAAPSPSRPKPGDESLEKGSRRNHRCICGWMALAVGCGVAMVSPTARADTANFELNGKIYTKWLYKNDDTRGCMSLSNPFWPDNIGGGNGVCSEFELNIRGRVSKYVSAGVRLKSRFGALWQGWWENGDTRWDNDNNLFVENTSGEALGMNHAAYIKLRGAWIRAAPPIPTVRWIHIGASDLGMFNEWTIGKSRYIDRDNAAGVFVEGDLLDGQLAYHTAAVAVPKLFVGPGWNTGLRNADELAGFWGAEWAYALKLEARPIDDLTITLIGNYIHDVEGDRFDPDSQGTSDRLEGADRAVDWVPRFQSVNATAEARYAPSWWDRLSVHGLMAFSSSLVNPEYAQNGVRLDQGFSPVVFKTRTRDTPFGPEIEGAASQDFAGKVLVEFFDPFDIGLEAKFEYFNIGSEFNAPFGARREADVLLTDGIIPSGFIDGGQLPTLNLANEFIDFDEPWYESVIGWHGATGLLEWVTGGLRMSGEYTFVTYNTNAQNRDVDNVFPDFLYTDGFTDPQAFTADFDYANIFDRGRDPRSVYKEFQDRRTHIAVVNIEYLLPFGNNFIVRGKGKFIDDFDGRRDDQDRRAAGIQESDDYDGKLYLGFVALSYQLTNELKVGLGYEHQYWDEQNRSGSQEAGFFDYETWKNTGRFTASYNFGGLSFGYLLEYFYKDQDRDRPGTFDQSWRVWRSKATVEVGW